MVLRNRQSSNTPTIESVPESEPRRHSSRAGLRGMSYSDGQRALSPVAQGRGGSASTERRASRNLLSARQISQAIPFNFKGHTVSMLVNIRSFLIRNGWLQQTAHDKGDRINQWPALVVDAAFVQAVAAYQEFKGVAKPNGRIDSQTFGLFEAQGLQYSLQGGSHKPNRDIVPKGAPDDQVYDYFRQIILDQGGIFLEKSGYVNIVAIRGGQVSGDGIRHVENTFNRWNDTIVVLSTDSAGKRLVQQYEGTTDPGVARQGVATLTEGTHNMELGYHAPRSGSYTALNPSYNGQVPVFRRGGGQHLGTDARGGQWLNVHTTHGYNQGALPGPGGYSEGCAVVNGQDQFARFIGRMKAASQRGQSNFFFTVISAGRLGTMQVESQQESPR